MNKKLLKNFCAVFLAWFMALLLLPQSAQAQRKEAYIVKSSDQKTLTFYYDDQKSSRTGTVWGIEETRTGELENTQPAWSGTWTRQSTKLLPLSSMLRSRTIFPKALRIGFFI